MTVCHFVDPGAFHLFRAKKCLKNSSGTDRQEIIYKSQHVFSSKSEIYII